MTDLKELNYTSIGTYQGKAVKRYDVPRQSSLQDHQGIIRLHDGFNFQQAIEDLKGMERLWVIYHFHLNESHWKAKVNTPRTLDGKKKSVLATRAPYRPNPIGMSCVKLDEIKGLKLMVSESDLLDGSPILDIKPYIPYADSFAPSKMGWLDNIESAAYTLHYDEFALTQIHWLEQKAGLDCKPYLERNLEYQPTNTRHKRVRKEKPTDTYHLGLKTWRLHFRLNSTAKTIQVLKVFPGYSKEELAVQEDPHRDKETHKMFINEFLKFDSELENLLG